MKYIDVDLLLKKIEKKSHEEQGFSSEDSEYGYRSCARDLLAFINSLQQEQPEVDLEEEYKTWWKSISGKINVEHIMEWYMHQTAHHFYELGLKARK